MKYGNRQTVIDGIVFDSALEARRYSELKLLERAGLIKDLRIQPKFTLQPAFEKCGKKYREISYIADFLYFDVDTGVTVVEDTKGFKTDVYKLKKKMFEFRFPELEIREVMK